MFVKWKLFIKNPNNLKVDNNRKDILKLFINKYVTDVATFYILFITKEEWFIMVNLLTTNTIRRVGLLSAHAYKIQRNLL